MERRGEPCSPADPEQRETEAVRGDSVWLCPEESLHGAPGSVVRIWVEPAPGPGDPPFLAVSSGEAQACWRQFDAWGRAREINLVTRIPKGCLGHGRDLEGAVQPLACYGVSSQAWRAHELRLQPGLTPAASLR
ncbi:hypothetical protein P7K49_017286 [Saguinus oedipus]|uniref:Uncharacterized protein n=1 Tax=Saguinus oedipus TaxID=9490 RepID=A0ABQ9V2B4_SAGOE|nr:hypothetical protein P7K49_017286 [Saguinus oedipus]